MPADAAVLVDSHAHLDMEDFDPDRDEVLDRARNAGVESVLCPVELTEPRSLAVLLDLKSRKDGIYLAAGVHPHRAKFFQPEHLARIRELAAAGLICALGEVGLDFHYDFSPAEVQRQAFRDQVALAGELDLPLIVHTREAGQEAADIMAETGFAGPGVLHCYTEGWALAERMLAGGFLVSFTGILSFPKADNVRQVARRVPLDKLMVETDSPYLVPAPWRGKKKRNEPAYVVEVAKALAEVKGLAPEALAEATTANFKALFRV